MTSEVILPPVSSALYANDNEPQMVIQRPSNVGYIYAESTDPYPQVTSGGVTAVNPVSMIASNRASQFDTPGILTAHVRRLCVNQFGMNWITPHVLNGWNNVLTVLVAGFNEFDAVVPEGFYYSPVTPGLGLVTALIAALNAAAPPGALFTATDMNVATVGFGPMPGYFKITCKVAGVDTVFNFPQLAKSTILTHGDITFGVEGGGAPTAAKLMYPQGYYTRYVDVVSQRLTQHHRLRTVTTHAVNNVIARIWITNSPWYGGSQPVSFTVSDLGINGISWNYNDPLSAFDVSLYDEFGNLLKMPSPEFALGKPAAQFAWSMNIRTEV